MDKWAVVTDASTRKAVSVIRSLGKSGYRVAALGDSFFTTGFWSRYCHKRISCKSAADDGDGFGQTLLNLLDDPNIIKPVIFPMEDASMGWCAENCDLLKCRANILIPPLDSLMIAENKAKTIKLAVELGIPCPKTFFSESKDEFMKRIELLGDSDFVVKPAVSSGSLGVLYGDWSDDVDWDKYWDSYGQAVIQERLSPDGVGIGISLLMDKDSNCIAHFAHERIHQYPIAGGPGTNRISIVHPELLELSLKLLKHLSWTGIAMVEWKMDSRTNFPKLMEINPRFWGSVELAVRAGVDFPTLYAKLASGEPVEPLTEYKVGIKCRWLVPGDILRFLGEKKAKKQTETFRQFLRGLPKEAEEWDRTDLRGTFACVVCQAALVLNPKYWKYLRR